MNTKHTRIIAAIGIIGVAGAGLVGCSSDSGSSTRSDCTPKHSDISTVASGTFTVGVTDLPPFSQNVSGGDPTGLDIDIVKKIADMECLDIEFKEATYANSIPMISQQQAIDVTTGAWYPTAERNEVVDFAGPMYTDSMSIVSKTGIKSVSELESLDSVGTVDGYLWTEDLKTLLGDKLKTYQSSVELQQDILNGRLDAGVDSYGTQVYEYKDQSGYQVEITEADDRVIASVEPAQTVLPLKKGNDSLKTALDEDLESMREDGTLADLIEGAGLDPSIVVPAGTELKIIGA
jgi:polar amino acid transport system substrate-binding protein